jgi:ribose 5-phosphate isomerase A
MDQNELKKRVAQAAVKCIPNHVVLGIGSGSTVNAFIDALAEQKIPLKGVVAASVASEARLIRYGYEILDLNSVDDMPYYVDGADEITRYGTMIKGGGAALTREKIIASVAKHFIAVVDESKMVARLGTFPLPVEVLPMARSFVSRKLVAMGGQPHYRTGVKTDNGMVLLDVRGLDLTDALAMEARINSIPGVLANGIFAQRRANTIFVSQKNGDIETINP